MIVRTLCLGAFNFRTVKSLKVATGAKMRSFFQAAPYNQLKSKYVEVVLQISDPCSFSSELFIGDISVTAFK